MAHGSEVSSSRVSVSVAFGLWYHIVSGAGARRGKTAHLFSQGAKRKREEGRLGPTLPFRGMPTRPLPLQGTPSSSATIKGPSLWCLEGLVQAANSLIALKLLSL